MPPAPFRRQAFDGSNLRRVCSRAGLSNRGAATTFVPRPPLRSCAGTGESLAKLYSDLDPRTELEQRVARDLDKALRKRGGVVTHHGTASSCAPSTAISDISVDWNEGGTPHRLLVEVAKRNDESEFTSIVEHLNRAVAAEPTVEIDVFYSGLSTSVRMARFLRNENQQRQNDGRRGRIIFLPLNRLQEYLDHWASAPAAAIHCRGLLRL